MSMANNLYFLYKYGGVLEVCMFIYMFIYLYIHTYTYMYIYLYIYMKLR
jgi:hypothetical protein